MTKPGKDSLEVVEFMALFARLKHWSDDAPEELAELAASDSSVKDLCTRLSFAAHHDIDNPQPMTGPQRGVDLGAAGRDLRAADGSCPALFRSARGNWNQSCAEATRPLAHPPARVSARRAARGDGGCCDGRQYGVWRPKSAGAGARCGAPSHEEKSCWRAARRARRGRDRRAPPQARSPEESHRARSVKDRPAGAPLLRRP